ncbi:Calmodulin-binding protein 60 C [Zea mays]|uniref:Calmodulin-binding protein 60 C n=1 Tax=Zea mays TaxID=4577 RepID=A0A1D6E9U5_MAIZE|nr:Calmodulin-binding protein 60 C [Zea mays]
MQRQGRHLERSNSKRALDHGGGGDDDDRPSKRPRVPALASVIVEALKVDCLQKLCSSLEPILRRIVSEEVERALAKLGPAGPARIQGRYKIWNLIFMVVSVVLPGYAAINCELHIPNKNRGSPKRIEGPDGRSLQLQFRTRLSLPLFTGGKVEGEQGAAIHVVLLDANTGHVVTSGPESSVKLDILVLEGDFNKEEDEGWTEEDFESHIVKEREGKRPILTGDLQVFADTLVKQAYADWINVLEYDGKALLKFNQKKKYVTTRSETAKASASYPASNGLVNSQKELPGGPVNAEQSSLNNASQADRTRIPSMSMGNQVAREYAGNPQHMTPSITMQCDTRSLIPGGQFSGGSSVQTQTSRSSNMLALRPTQQPQNLDFSGLGQSTQPSGTNPFADWSRLQESSVDEYLMDEIRARSHELLENDEMQHMLRFLSVGGAPTGLNNVDGFLSYPSPAPAFGFDEDDRARSSGKAVVGWLKIKAAMRWGIFVRRKAAERRAQLVELED